MGNTITILIVHAVESYRTFLTRIIAKHSDLELVAAVPNGQTGRIKVKELKPEVILLDPELKDIDCVRFTKEVLEQQESCGIILCVRNGSGEQVLVDALRALELGAFDLYQLPENMTLAMNAAVESNQDRKLIVRIRAYSIKRYSRIAMALANKTQSENTLSQVQETRSVGKPKLSSIYKLLAIGVSTGGPRALSLILPQFPATFPLPIVIVIHLPRLFTASLVRELAKKSHIKVLEAVDAQELQPGCAYIARGGSHLVIKKGTAGKALLYYEDSPPRNNCKPSVDILFDSVNSLFGEKAIAVLLTGMGEDGAQAMKALRTSGARTLVQDRESSEVWGMPGSAVNLGAVEEVLPLDKVVPRIMEVI